MADSCCENCGWSEIVGSPIMCNFTGHRTFRDEICQAWKPKELPQKEQTEVILCKDCKYGKYDKINQKYQCEKIRQRTWFIIWHDGDFFCKDGVPKDGEQ